MALTISWSHAVSVYCNCFIGLLHSVFSFQFVLYPPLPSLQYAAQTRLLSTKSYSKACGQRPNFPKYTRNRGLKRNGHLLLVRKGQSFLHALLCQILLSNSYFVLKTNTETFSLVKHQNLQRIPTILFMS